MQVNDKNSMWQILNGNYNQNKEIGTNPQSQGSNSVFNTQKAEEIQGIDSVFSQNITNQSEKITDSFEISPTLQNMQQIAKDFDGDFQKLGDSMLQSGIFNQEEKIGFDALFKANPRLDSITNQNIINNSNLNANYANLLSGVDKKIDMMRFLGNF